MLNKVGRRTRCLVWVVSMFGGLIWMRVNGGSRRFYITLKQATVELFYVSLFNYTRTDRPNQGLYVTICIIYYNGVCSAHPLALGTQQLSTHLVHRPSKPALLPNIVERKTKGLFDSAPPCCYLLRELVELVIFGSLRFWF